MKKRNLALALVIAAMLLGFSGCNSETEPQQDEPPYTGTDNGHITPEILPDYIDEIEEIDWSLFPIIIDGAIGVAADWHTAEGEYFPTHIPLIPVVEALGTLETLAIYGSYPQVVTLQGLNGAIVFTVGSYEFTIDGNTIELWQPSLLVGGEIYVPIAFFRDAFGMGNAMWMGGHVHLDTHGAGDMH